MAQNITPLDYRYLYSLWLQGQSLRALARLTGKSHTFIARKFAQMFGKDATNPRVKSFARSLYSDYPEVSWSIPDIQGNFRSIKTIDGNTPRWYIPLGRHDAAIEDPEIYEHPEVIFWFSDLPGH